MEAHEERVGRAKRNNQEAHAWYQSCTVCPPEECPTDDEFESTGETRFYKGRFVERRKYTRQLAVNYLSKFYLLVS